MNSFSYNPLADAIMVSYVCSKCNNTNNEYIAVPSPDLTAETAGDSVSTDTIEIQCQHCEKDLCIELATSYNGGFGIIRDAEIISVEEDFPDEENHY